MSETKKILFDHIVTKPSVQESKVIKHKQPSKRKITTTEKWNFSDEELSYDRQLSYIEQLYTNKIQD